MANVNPKTEHLISTQWQAGQSGNPNGKPKGTKHLATWIQEIMEDETFEALLPDVHEGWKTYKGAPVKAIVLTLITKAACGDMRAFDLIGRYGYGAKIDLTSKDKELPTPILNGISIKSLDDGGRESVVEKRIPAS